MKNNNCNNLLLLALISLVVASCAGCLSEKESKTPLNDSERLTIEGIVMANLKDSGMFESVKVKVFANDSMTIWFRPDSNEEHSAIYGSYNILHAYVFLTKFYPGLSDMTAILGTQEHPLMVTQHCERNWADQIKDPNNVDEVSNLLTKASIAP